MATRPVRLKYHQATVDLLGKSPVVSKESVRIIEKFEKKRRLALPASVREWYSLTLVHRRPRTSFYGWTPLPSFLESVEAIQRNRLPAKRQIQIFGDPNEPRDVRLDGSDDPPVVYPTGHEECFSFFAFRKVWEGMHWRRKIWLQAPHHVLGPVMFDFMKERLREGPVSQDERSTTYRFFTRAGHIQIDCEGDPALGEVPASWYCRAETQDDLAELVRPFWNMGDLSEALTSVILNPFNPTKPIVSRGGTIVLDRLEREFGQT